MQALAVLCLFAVGVFSVELEHDGDIYDRLDLKNIVETEELRNEAYDCLMDLGPCREEYQIIRDVVPRILKTQCADCNASQKEVFNYTVEYLKKNDNDKFKKMSEKYGQ